MVCGTFTQALLLTPMMIPALQADADREALGERLMDFVMSPLGMIVMATPMQLAFLGAAIATAILGAWSARRAASDDQDARTAIRRSVVQQLGLAAPKAPALSYPVIVLGVLAPALLGVAISSAALREAGVDLADNPIYAKMTAQMAIPFTAFIAITPAFCEEFFFRGFAQRRLTRRFGPWLAIWQSTMLFALVHLAPAQVIFVIPIGAWLGYVSWRTDSIWLTVASHAVVNASWNVWMILSISSDMGSVSQPWIIGILATAAICFPLSVWILQRCPKGAGPDRPPPPEPIPSPEIVVIEATLAPPILATLADSEPTKQSPS